MAFGGTLKRFRESFLHLQVHPRSRESIVCRSDGPLDAPLSCVSGSVEVLGRLGVVNNWILVTEVNLSYHNGDL